MATAISLDFIHQPRDRMVRRPALTSVTVVTAKAIVKMCAQQRTPTNRRQRRKRRGEELGQCQRRQGLGGKGKGGKASKGWRKGKASGLYDQVLWQGCGGESSGDWGGWGAAATGVAFGHLAFSLRRLRTLLMDDLLTGLLRSGPLLLTDLPLRVSESVPLPVGCKPVTLCRICG